ncbi:MAG: hypothetical protein CMI96_00645 [Pelagibacteraceae bacterium]|nr:hypothetical protein [Pelagibacteraceae bacterium]|tara:strand:- start:55349 stop:55849 length:501 start_codon:yes stop_codon:yes gene_type:complete
MKTLIITLMSFFFLFSCSGFEFVLQDDSEINLLKNKSSFVIKNKDDHDFKKQLIDNFGKSDEPEYEVNIEISEKETNIAVSNDQRTTKKKYEIVVQYSVFSIVKNCNIINVVNTSSFYFVPKAFGYNFGSDQSLERLYENAYNENIQDFTNHVYENLHAASCINEG